MNHTKQKKPSKDDKDVVKSPNVYFLGMQICIKNG